MTSPGPDDTTRRLAAAGAAVGPTRPQLALTLASSDLSHGEIKAVGGFVNAMQASVARRLAADSGAKTDFTPEELNHLNGIGEHVAQEDKQDDSRSFFEKATDAVAGALSNTGNFLIHNPVTDKLLGGMEWLGNAAHMPFRLLSDGLDQGNNDEIDAAMKARGYDPNSTASYLAFMFSQGESQYHDLNDVRDTYGDDDVDLALKLQADPEQFQADLEKMDPEEAARIKDRLNSKDFQDGVYAAVDQKHISPGRDIARILTVGHTDNKAFTLISGGLDAAYDWFTDPTLILGKANKVIKAADALGRDASGLERFLTSLPGQARRRAGIADMTDQAGIEALLRTENGQAVTQVGRGWERYLKDAADLRAADAAGDAAKRAGIYTAMRSRYGVLMDLLPEINGGRVISDTDALSGFRVDAFTDKHLVTNGKPIETLDDLTKHLVSTNGLLRINNGMAAREAVVMPGRLSYVAERKAALFGSAAAKDTRKAKSTARWIDYAKPDQLLPNEAEAKILDEYGDNEAVRAGLAQRNLLLKASLTSSRAFAAKIERVRRRFTTQLPSVQRLDLTDPSSAKTVEQIARFYLNRGDSAKLASAYALAPDLAARRAIVRGVLQQSFHASGLSRSEAGRNFMERFIADQGALEKQQYGYDKTSLVETDSGARQMALYPDQISQHVVLPSMREMNYLATKFAVGGFAGRKGLADVRALSQSSGMDQLMGTIKLGWITSAAGGLRNALDEVANFAAYGIGKDVLAARVAYTKATAEHRAERRAASKARLDQIRSIGRAASDDRIASRLGEGMKSHEDALLELERATDPADIEAARRNVASARKELDRAVLLAGAISHRLPYFARVVGDTINDKLIGSVLGKAMSVMGKDWAITGERVKWANELANRESGVVLRDGVFQAHHADTQLTGASDATAMDYHRAGLMARKYKFVSQGWGEVEADGGAGLDAWAKTLGLRFRDSNSPAHSWLQTYRSLPHGTPEERTAALKAARESVLRRLDDEDMRHFVNQAEVFQWYKGTKIAKGDEEMRRFAKEDYADRVTLDLVQALGGEKGALNEKLVDELLAGRVPDRSWLANNIPADERPSHAIGQLWAPYNPAHQLGQINRGYTGMLSKAYNKVVTDQIDALSRNPLVTALYMRARENTKSYVEHLVANGWDREIADDIGRRIASQHAEVEAFRHIDNPYVSSQFSMLARNQFAFVRAQEDWLKRWGRTIKDNPELIRKAQLLIHGGESVGFLEQDDQGQLHFVYPGSGLMLGILGGFFGAMNQPNGARVPVQGELSSQLTFLNPSLDNPLGFSGTPLVSLPWKAIAHFLGPDHALMNSSIDKVINGDLGAGREWWEQMLPSWANRIIGGVLPTEDMGSKYGAAIQSSIANLTAAGAMDDPQVQTPEGKARLLHALQVGIHNDLLATALFGFLLPAAPTYEGKAGENADGYQGTTADWSAHEAGLRSLKDEARQVFARLPFEEAKAWWAKVHPNESILAPTGGGSRTSVGADSANAPATVAAASYIEKHTKFFAKYGGKGGVGAYLIPQGKPGTTNGEYSDVAYRAQLELGIRNYKSLDEYFDQVVTSRGYAEYFREKDKYDAQKVEAGNSTSLNRAADQAWAEKRQEILDGNPLLAQRLAANAVDNAATGPTIQSLHRMVEDTSKETTAALGPNRAGIAAMLAAKHQYDEGTAALGDRRGNSANRKRNDLKLAYDAQINQLATQYPGLADLARGVFRPAS